MRRQAVARKEMDHETTTFLADPSGKDEHGSVRFARSIHALVQPRKLVR